MHTSRERKSLGREETFSKDLTSLPHLLDELKALADKTAHDLQNRKITGRTLTLKVKYGDFHQITRSQTLRYSANSEDTLFEAARKLLLEKTEAGQRRIRLLGLSVSNLEKAEESAWDNSAALLD